MTDQNSTLPAPASLQPPSVPQNALATGPGVTGGSSVNMDPAQSVLTRAAGLDRNAQHDAWNAYHASADENELASHLQSMNLPKQVKHDLWEAKHTEGLIANTKSAPKTTSMEESAVPYAVDAIKQGFVHGIEAGVPITQFYTHPKRSLVTAGAVAAPMLIAPGAGLLGTAALAGVGGGVGNTAGRVAEGQNPVSPEGLKESARVGAEMGLSELGLGLLGKGVGKVWDWFHPVIDSEIPEAGAAFQPALNNTPKEIVKHASDSGIDLTPAQATQSPFRKGVQDAGEHAAIGGSDLHEAIQNSNEQLNSSVKDFQRRLDPQMQGTSPESAGEAVQQSVRDLKDAAHESASQGYRNLPEDLQNAPVDVKGIRAAWAQDAAKMQTVLNNIPDSSAAPLRAVLNMGTRLGTADADGVLQPYLSFADAAQMRSVARELGETRVAELPARYQGLFKKLATDIDGAMESAATQSGFVDEWRAANEGWRNYTTTFGDQASPLYKILRQADPAKVTNAIKNASAKDIETLVNAGVDLSAIKNQIVDDIARGGWKVTRDGLGGYNDGVLSTLFGRQATKELYLKAALGRRLLANTNPSGSAKLGATIAQTVNPKLAGAMSAGAKASMPRAAESYLPAAEQTVWQKIGQIAKGAANAGRFVWTASDGSIHSAPDTPANRQEVLRIDPQAQFHQ